MSPTALSVSMPRRQRNRATVGAHGTLDRLFCDQGIQTLAPGKQHLVVGQVLAEDDLKQWLVKARSC